MVPLKTALPWLGCGVFFFSYRLVLHAKKMTPIMRPQTETFPVEKNGHDPDRGVFQRLFFPGSATTVCEVIYIEVCTGLVFVFIRPQSAVSSDSACNVHQMVFGM